jgi:hypothetical protein
LACGPRVQGVPRSDSRGGGDVRVGDGLAEGMTSGSRWSATAAEVVLGWRCRASLGQLGRVRRAGRRGNGLAELGRAGLASWSPGAMLGCKAALAGWRPASGLRAARACCGAGYRGWVG